MPTDHETPAPRLNPACRLGAAPPLRYGLDPTGAEDAYSVRQVKTQKWLSDGRQFIGRKIGLTVELTPTPRRVDHPDDNGASHRTARESERGVLSPMAALKPDNHVGITIGGLRAANFTFRD